jgi:aminoglycoside phosphotransferase (APT) family kinase protein
VRSDTAPVRSGEELNLDALRAYLSGRIDGDPSTLRITQFPNGHSNLVYLVETAGREYVLRRPPLGPVAPKAHDMAREYKVLCALHPHFPEAPGVYLLCEDPDVIGAPFFLMERRSGLVIRDDIPPTLAGRERNISEAFIDCLVRLHSIDVTEPALAALGKPAGFLERQVKGWSDRWWRAKTHELPQMDRVIQWLQDRLPPSPAPTMVHNDYKLDNVMMRDSGDRVEAVLDWEMATLGDPLSDVGLTLCYWAWASRAASTDDSRHVIPILTTQPGWYTRDEFLHLYATRTGRDLSHIDYHEILGVFKLAVILQQIFYRFHAGQTRDERFRHFDRRVQGLVQLCAELVGRQA